MTATPQPRRRRYRAAAVIAIAAAAALVFTACSSSGGDSSSGSTSAASSKPVSGGKLTVDLSATPVCLDPAVAFSGNERAVTRELADSLIYMTKDGQFKPWLASSWEVNSNATAYTFHLKKGATFSDGSPVDAQSVKDTFDFLTKNLLSSSSRGRGYLSGYAGTKVIDPQTAEVDFSTPAVQFLAGASTSTLAILSSSSTQYTPAERCQGKFVGSGPFTLKSYTQGQGAVLTKRTGYDWAPGGAAHTGDAYLDEIDFQVVGTPNVRDGQLETGQADVALDIATQDLPALKQASVTPMFGTQPGLPVSLIPNTLHPGLNDPVVRQAIEIGFDRAADVKAVLGDDYKPATSILTSNLPTYKDESSKIKFDATKAKKLLQDDGWVAGSDGIRAKDGTKLSLTVAYTDTFGAYYTSLLQLFQQQMKDIGVGINISNYTQAQLTSVSQSHSFDFYITSLTDSDPDIIRSTVAGSLFADPAALKSSGITDLFTKTQAESNAADRKATYGQIQDAFIDNGYAIPFWEGGQLVGSTKQVHGLEMDFQSWLDFYDTWKSAN